MRKIFLHGTLLLCLTATAVCAQEAVPLSYTSNSYYRNRALNQAYSGTDFTVRAREAIRSTRYGNRGLNSVFKNFNPGHNIDWNIPGVKKNFDLIGSINPGQIKGAVRTQLYATTIYNTPGLQLLAIGEPVRDVASRRIITDKDILFRDLVTGRRYRMEVKDVSLGTQRTNMANYKRQILLMSQEARRTGEKQIWVNRREVAPEIAAYAKRLGVDTHGNVTTSKAPEVLKRNRALSEVLGKYSSVETMRQAAGFGAGVYGLYMMIRSAPQFFDAWKDFLGKGSRGEAEILRLAQATTGFVGGGVLIASNFAPALQRFRPPLPPGAPVKGLRTVMRWMGKNAGRVAWVLIAVDLGFDVYLYTRGYMPARDFAVSVSGKLFGLGGALAGAWIGAKGGAAIGAGIGALFGPAGAGAGGVIGGFVGSISGGIAGYWGGSTLAQTMVKSYYALKDEESHRKHFDFLVDHYSASVP